MHSSHHAAQRMRQRGIPRRLVDFTLRHGRIEGDKRVLDRNESRRIIEIQVLALNPSEAGVDGEIIPISVPTD